MNNKTKCKHYKGKGRTYKIIDGEINICEECEKLLKKGMTEQIELESKLILPITKGKSGQMRITIPRDSKIDTKYAKVTRHES